MKHLILSVDHWGPPLCERGHSPGTEWPIDVPMELKDELIRWNEEFSKIIAADDLINPQLDIIYRELNVQGKDLADRLNSYFINQAKVDFLPEKRS